jgi:hypothetical protein
MTLDTERTETQDIDTANLPPHTGRKERGYHLFQTIEELHARHGNAKRAKDRVMHATGALTAGLLLFVALYTLILLFE